jgi:hypothetical protein
MPNGTRDDDLRRLDDQYAEIVALRRRLERAQADADQLAARLGVPIDRCCGYQRPPPCPDPTGTGG